jgi:hypothetical protein
MGKVRNTDQECLFPMRSIEENHTSRSNCIISDSHKHPFVSSYMVCFVVKITTELDNTLKME